MNIQLNYNNQQYRCDLSRPIDISIALGDVKCFYAPDFKVQPYQSGDFVGAVNKGAPVNFFDVQLNPHGNGTHTECLGHITKKQESINKQLVQFHFIAQLVTVPLEESDDGDSIIKADNLKLACPKTIPEALIIRTTPNPRSKMNTDYSGTNPAYMDRDAMAFIVQRRVRHLLIDLPSVDKEEDQGKLLCHRIFWNVEDARDKDGSRSDCTITELIYVPDEVADGLYLLNIQIPSMELDAAPSKPVIFKLYHE